MTSKKAINKLALAMAFVLLCTTLFAAMPLSKASAAAPKSRISLNITDLVIAKGKAKRLKITGTKKKVTWKSSKPSVAKVSKKGRVRAVRAGNAKITARVGGKNTPARYR